MLPCGQQTKYIPFIQIYHFFLFSTKITQAEYAIDHEGHQQTSRLCQYKWYGIRQNNIKKEPRKK